MWEKKWCSDREKLLKFEAEGREFAKEEDFSHPLGVKGDFLVQGSDGGGTFCLLLGIYIKFGYKNPSILTPLDSVDVAS